jgi:hypothetical protein
MSGSATRALEFDHEESCGCPESKQLLPVRVTTLVAAVTTAVWAGILCSGSWIAGIDIKAGWLAPALMVIFLLLRLGLGMAANVSETFPPAA